MQISDYFSKLWFTKKEREIFLSLYKLWNQPASVVAKHLNMDRTTVYKILILLSEKGLVSVTEKSKTKHFFIPDIAVLKWYIRSQQKQYTQLENEFEILESELLRYDDSFSSKIPKISLYDWASWVWNAFNEMFSDLEKSGYLSIKMFASNILDSYVYTKSNISDYSNDFHFKEIYPCVYFFF